MVKALTSFGIFLVVFFGLFVMGMVVPPAQPAKAVTTGGLSVLKFKTPTSTPAVNDTFSVSVLLDAGSGVTINTVDLGITFPKDILQLESGTAGTDFPDTVPTFDNSSSNLQNINSLGKIPASGTKSFDKDAGATGDNNEVAVFVFKAISSGTANLAFSNNSEAITTDTGDDHLGTIQTASITVGGSAQTTTATTPPTTVTTAQPTVTALSSAGPEDTIIGSWVAAATFLLAAFCLLRFRRAWKLSK